MGTALILTCCLTAFLILAWISLPGLSAELRAPLATRLQYRSNH